jgi:hypothetical protein
MGSSRRLGMYLEHDRSSLTIGLLVCPGLNAPVLMLRRLVVD